MVRSRTPIDRFADQRSPMDGTGVRVQGRVYHMLVAPLSGPPSFRIPLTVPGDLECWVKWWKRWQGVWRLIWSRRVQAASGCHPHVDIDQYVSFDPALDLYVKAHGHGDLLALTRCTCKHTGAGTIGSVVSILLGTAGYLYWQKKTASPLHYMADMIARCDGGYRQDPDYRNDCGFHVQISSPARCLPYALPAISCFCDLQSQCVVGCCQVLSWFCSSSSFSWRWYYSLRLLARFPLFTATWNYRGLIDPTLYWLEHRALPVTNNLIPLNSTTGPCLSQTIWFRWIPRDAQVACDGWEYSGYSDLLHLEPAGAAWQIRGHRRAMRNTGQQVCCHSVCTSAPQSCFLRKSGVWGSGICVNLQPPLLPPPNSSLNF